MSIIEKVAEMRQRKKSMRRILKNLGITEWEYEEARVQAVKSGLLPALYRSQVSNDLRGRILADVEDGASAAELAEKHGICMKAAEYFVGSPSDIGAWPDLPANAFQDDPSAYLPVPGKTIFGLAGAA